MNGVENYPSSDDVDSWVESILQQADCLDYLTEIVSKDGIPDAFGIPLSGEYSFIKFSIRGMDDFYAYWQPSHSNPAPLLVQVPSYYSEIHIHPELTISGYNVLHISPLGSLFKDRGVRCIAADVPFSTNFPLADGTGAYRTDADAVNQTEYKAAAWKALGFIDTLSHAHRLLVPVLLTQGGRDTACPPDTIQTLFERLPGTRSITYLDGVEHRCTVEFLYLSMAWFRLYA